MKTTLKAIADGVNAHKDALLFNKALNEIKTVINDGNTLLETAKRGEYSYTVYLSEKPKSKFVEQIKAEMDELGLDFICFSMYGLIESVTIKWY